MQLRRIQGKAFRALGTAFGLAGDGLWEIGLESPALWCWDRMGYYMSRYWYG